jgi:hypothetical protein
MSAGICIYEGFVSAELTSFTAKNQTAFRGTVRVPDSRKMLDGTYGSMFKDFVIWPGSSAYIMLERMRNAGKPIGAGSQVKVVLLETEAEYSSETGKKIATNYECLDLSFVSRSSKGTVTDATNASATSVVDSGTDSPAVAPSGITL